MRRLALAIAALSLGLGACTPTPPLTPSSVANQTKLDEQVGLTVTLAYTAAARAAALAIKTGLVKDKATIARIGELDKRAYAAVLGVRAAYQAGNATDYLSALTQARTAIAALLGAARDPVASLQGLPADLAHLKVMAETVQLLHESGRYLVATDHRLALLIGAIRHA